MLNPTLATRPTIQKARMRSHLPVALIGALALIVIAVVMSVSASAPSAADMRIQNLMNALNQEPLTEARQEAQSQLESAGTAAVPALTAALRSNNWVMRRNAADMLGYIASPAATPALQELLKNEVVPAVRVNAARSLGEINTYTAVSDLQRAAVLDKNALVRETANDSLARVRTRLALSSHTDEQALNAFAVAPKDANVVYATTKRDILVTQNGGATWNTLAQTLPSLATTLAVSPLNNQVLYAGVDSMGIYRSTDGGKTWNAVNNGLNVPAGARFVINALTIDPANAQHVAASTGVWLGSTTMEYHPLDIVQTLDGGATWTSVSQVKRAEPLANLAIQGSQLFALAGNQVLSYALN
jgi:photosystem II stability/assembly factor-like uncharacterized protein